MSGVAEIEDSKRLSRIAVIGAAGLSGVCLLNYLRRTNRHVRALVHSLPGAKRATDAGASETVQIDLSDRSSLKAALERADAVYMIPPAFESDEHTFAITALRAAEQAGAKRFVYVSVMHPHTPALPHHMRKATVEDEIHKSSLAWTILQPSMYAQMICSTFGAAPPGVVKVPYNVASSFSVIDLRELSEIGLKVLTEDGHACATYELCGDQLTMAAMVRIAAEMRKVDLEPVTIDPAEAPLPPRYAGQPSASSDMRAMFQEYHRYGYRGNSNVLRMLLGREPASFEDVARDILAKV